MNITNSVNSNSPPINQNPYNLPYIPKDLEIGFFSSVIHTFLLIFFAELGDKTFIMLIILQLRTNKPTIFFSAVLAELLMNYLAIIFGKFLDIFLYKNLIEYICILFYIVYGFYVFGNGFTEKEETFESELSLIDQFNQEIYKNNSSIIEKRQSLEILSNIDNNNSQKIESTQNIIKEINLKKQLTIIPETENSKDEEDSTITENTNSKNNTINNSRQDKSKPKRRQSIIKLNDKNEIVKKENTKESDPFGRKLYSVGLRRKSLEMSGQIDPERLKVLEILANNKSEDSKSNSDSSSMNMESEDSKNNDKKEKKEKKDNKKNIEKKFSISENNDDKKITESENTEDKKITESENNEEKSKENENEENLFINEQNDFLKKYITEEDKKHVQQENIDTAVFKTIFVSMALSECGDRTQICSMTFSSISEFWGVLFGSSIALILSCVLGVYYGKKVINCITKKALNIIVGTLFIGFAIEILLFKKSYLLSI